jgi:hypothetical protein
MTGEFERLVIVFGADGKVKWRMGEVYGALNPEKSHSHSHSHLLVNATKVKEVLHSNA